MRNWLPISKGKKKDIGGYVRLTLAKLSGIRADLVRLDDNWQEWSFPQLVEALKKWMQMELGPPWFASLGDVTRRETYRFKLNRRVESIGGLFTVSLRNINQVTVTRLKWGLTGEGTCQTISCVLTELALGIDQSKIDALLPARGVMRSTIVQFETSFQIS